MVQIPVDATAYANRGPYHNVLAIFRWFDQELDAKMARLERDLLLKIQNRAGDIGTAGKGVGIYANYAGMAHSWPPLGSFAINTLIGRETNAKELFGDNLPRLQELKKLYDPNNVFQKWHNLFIPSTAR